jgi:thiopurine S-methyltransferase
VTIEAHMDQGFWNERWAQGQIGFHKPAPHDLLVAHYDGTLKGRQRVYVPLCGKSVDLVWLRDHGHDVVGCEFVGSAVAAFFAEQVPEAAPTSTRVNELVLHETRGIRIVQGDAFAIDAFATGGHVDAIWDRAALVAIDPKDRARYVEALLRVLVPGGVILLVTFTYDQAKVPGPPWSVTDDDVRTLFGATCTIEKLEARDEELGPKFVEAGVTSLVESAFLLTKR